jgi:formylglycine-generating enzyme required for sulfatase activity
VPLVLNGDAGARGDRVSRFFARVAKHFANEMAVVTPNGDLLAHDLDEGVRRWRALPEAKRRALDDLGSYDAALDPAPPARGLILEVFARALAAGESSKLSPYKTEVARSFEPGRDRLWLSESEWRALLPRRLETGESAEAPPAIVERLCRRALIDLVRVGGNGHPRRAEDVLEKTLRMTVLEADDDVARLGIEGEARVASRDPGFGARGGAPKIDAYVFQGEAHYDLASRRFASFDLAAFSPSGHYDEIHDRVLPFGVAFGLLAGRTPAERLAPSQFDAAYFGPRGRARFEALAARAAGLRSAEPRAKELELLRRELGAFVESGEGAESAERALALLLALPRGGPPPTAPDFPFDARAARRYQRRYAAWAGLPLEFENRAGLRFALVPPGRFLMGSPAGEPGREGGGHDETRHEIALGAPFYLAKHELTLGQLRAFVEASGHVTDGERRGGGHAHDARAVWEHRPGTQWRRPGYAGPFEARDDHPAVHVSHGDGIALCRWLDAAAPGAPGLAYGLPSEAQWEWACRAGSGARFWWGESESGAAGRINAGDRSLKSAHPEWPRAIFPMDDGHAFLAPVGSYEANAFGLHDMLGNVWEWCSTRAGRYPVGPLLDPGDIDPRAGFAVRGGGWSNVPADLRCATRNADAAEFCHSNLGLRVGLFGLSLRSP